MDDFRAVFADERVDLALLAAPLVQVLAEEKASRCRDHSHRQSHQKMLCSKNTEMYVAIVTGSQLAPFFVLCVSFADKSH